ncbi:DUF4190 domain-containing protein [Nocardioides sp.]|uniref:DUF4190 domain-containing protein n=1 Tax=Nocardioides sp. TaxID=35761 RepID=UPI002B275C51|nr:DUF4190 domain-containing protein [Nocardioides sp.]
MSSYPPSPPEGGPYGSPEQPYPYGAPSHGTGPQGTSGKATTSLVLGILSLLCFGLLSGIPAMIIGRSATKEIDASHGSIGGRGLATAGFVTGLIGTVFSTLGIIAMVLALGLGSAGTVTFQEACTDTTGSGFNDC